MDNSVQRLFPLWSGKNHEVSVGNKTNLLTKNTHESNKRTQKNESFTVLLVGVKFVFLYTLLTIRLVSDL